MLLQKERTSKIVECENFQCKYSLLKSPSGSGAFTYGISVQLFADGLLNDSCEIYDITTNRKKADQLLALLMKGFVTPQSCYEVIDNFLAVQ